MPSIQNDNWGVSFTIPDGWNSKFESPRYLITSGNSDELLLVFQHNLKTREELLTDFKNWTTGDLVPADGIYYEFGSSSIGYAIHGTYQKIPVYGFMVATGNLAGKGLTVMILVSNNLFEQRHAELAATISSTVIFFERSININSDFPQIQQKFAKKRLHYMESYSSNSPGGGGYSREQKINLFEDQSFSFWWQSVIYGPVGSSNKDSGNGSWRIAKGNAGGPILELNFDDARQYTYDMVENAGIVYLNNQKHFIESL